MEKESLKNSIAQYKEQLKQINIAISLTDGGEIDDLINLKGDIEQLIELTEENLETITQKEQPSTSTSTSTSGTQNVLDDEYALFMQEMEKDGAVEQPKPDIKDDLKSLEGMKCRAPHVHSWGDTVFHNAMVCNVISSPDEKTFHELKVQVMYTNPTHQEMLPCPYFLDGSCKFDEEKCKFSHGEIVLLSDLREYNEPDFTNVRIGCKVLAKRSNKLWQRAVVKQNKDNECTIKFESNQQEHILPLHDILPLDSDDNSDSSSDSDSENDEIDNEWAVQQSLINTPPSEKLGDWEKYTKGIGSKLMQQMGYVIGTGLGRHAEGRIEPVQAVILPAGKSLDHCMTLRENAGGDENLFSVERRLKKIQKQQEKRNEKAYEREKQKKDVFKFLNETLVLSKNVKTSGQKKMKHNHQLKAETNRDLNVASLKIEDDIKRVEMDLFKINESLERHNNPDTAMNKNLKAKLICKQEELKKLHDYSRNVKNEQNLRKDHKKLTVF